MSVSKMLFPALEKPFMDTDRRMPVAYGICTREKSRNCLHGSA